MKDKGENTMYPRTEYEMSESDLKEILEACRPTPVMFISGAVNIGGDQQENANRAWAALGLKMGFDPMTVKPVLGKGMRFFTAIPSETDEARKQRIANEEKEKRLARISTLREEIIERQKELAKLASDV